MKIVEITLAPSEIAMASNAGIQRQVKGIIRAGRTGRYGADNIAHGFQYNVEGTIGECAVAKYFGIFWSGELGNFAAKDVGPYQVRATSHKNGCLRVHKEDSDTDVFILALLHAVPRVTIYGWQFGRDAKVETFWCAKSGARFAYFNPQYSLRDLAELDRP